MPVRSDLKQRIVKIWQITRSRSKTTNLCTNQLYLHLWNPKGNHQRSPGTLGKRLLLAWSKPPPLVKKWRSQFCQIARTLKSYKLAAQWALWCTQATRKRKEAARHCFKDCRNLAVQVSNKDSFMARRRNNTKMLTDQPS